MKASKKEHNDQSRRQSGPFIQRMSQSPDAEKEEMPFISRKPESIIQPQLTIGQPNDPYEQEADRMADYVMRSPQTTDPPPMISRMHAGYSTTQRMCSECEKEKEERVQPKAEAGGPNYASEGLSQRLQNRKGQGAPLSPAVQSKMEQGFGTDFSDVRVHTDSKAVQMSRELNAQAFTHGSDIYFNRGKYQPGTDTGQRLLGHELTHVVQQGGEIGDSLDSNRKYFEVTQNHLKHQGHFIEKDKNNIIRRTTTQNISEDSSHDDLLTFDLESEFSSISNEDNINDQTAKNILIRIITQKGFTSAVSIIKNLEDENFFQRAFKLLSPEDEAYLQIHDKVVRVFKKQLIELYIEYFDFGKKVRNAAEARLIQNKWALDEWTSYIDSIMPRQITRQVVTEQTFDLLMTAVHSDSRVPGGAIGAFERWATEVSPHRRELVLEPLIEGEVHSGCQACHNEIFSNSKELEAGYFPGYQIPSGPAYVAPLSSLTDFARNELVDPTIRPDFTDDQVVRSRTMDKWIFQDIQSYPATTIIAHSINVIRPYVEPLGENGYNVLPPGVINSNMSDQELVEEILRRIKERQEKYDELIKEIKEPDYEFFKLKPIVETLLPFIQDPDALEMIEALYKKYWEQDFVDAIFTMIAEIITLLLIIFPPTTALGLTIAGISGLVAGYESFQQGKEYEQGIGANVFSPEQEEGAVMLMMGGVVSMALAASDLGTITGKAIRLVLPKRSNFQLLPKSKSNLVQYEQTPDVKATVSGYTSENQKIDIQVTGLDKNNSTVEILVDGEVRFIGSLSDLETIIKSRRHMTTEIPREESINYVFDMREQVFLDDSSSLLLEAQPSTSGLLPAAPIETRAPDFGVQPAYSLSIGSEGTGGIMLMGRGLHPSDFLGMPLIADNPQLLALWNQAIEEVVNTGRSNWFTRWQLAVEDGTVYLWSNEGLGKAFDVVRKKYFSLCQAKDIDVATIHHWNFPKANYPESIVDPRHLVHIPESNLMNRGYHPAHQGALHPLTTSNPNATVGPVDLVHELPLNQ